MSICLIKPGATLEFGDYKAVLDHKKWLDFATCLLISHIYVKMPLTPSQLKRLPSRIRHLISDKPANPDNSAAWLEQLWSLEDPRG